MNIINASYEILNDITPENPLYLTKKIESVARTCYKSEDLITEDSCIRMVDNLIKRNHCYDTETEILTLNGWKKYNEINNNDLFATLNENGFVEYLPSAGYTCYEYSGKMIKVNTHMVDLLVTDKHKMYVCKTTTKEGRKKEKYELLEADTLLNTPHAYLKKSNGYVNSKTNIPLDVLRLLGFAIGDGSISHSLSFHLSKERKIKYLKDICNNLKLDITSSKDSKGYIRISIGLTQPNLVDYAYLFKDIYNSEKEKKIPHELLKMMDKEECEALLDGLQNSDGHTTKDNSSYYCTTSEELKGQFQQLCLHCGYSSNEVGITDLSEKSNFNSNKILSKMSIIKRENTPEINKSKNTKGTIEEIDNWNGLVWCVNIPPYHNVYVRRNGKPVWCGNCAMLEHASLVFNVDETSFFDTLDVVESLEKGLFYDHEYETFKSYLRFTDDNANYIISGNIRAWIEFLQICNKFFNKIPAFFGYYISKDRYDTVTNDIDVLFKDFINVPYGTFTYPEDNNILVKRIIYLSELSIRERLIHQDLSVKFTVDRGVTHELVRMRDCSFAQESTRYVSYSKKSDSIDTEEDVLYLYCEAGMSMKKIADRSNGKYTEWDIYKILEENNIQKRNFGSRGIIHEDYFEVINTPEKAFLLGFITADGNMRNDLSQLTITQKEDESWWILNMIRDFIQPDAKSLTISNKKLCKDLFNKGIIPNKTYDFTQFEINKLWDSIPYEYKYDFIRGLLDGDGNIRWFYQKDTSKTMSCNIGFTGNKFLLQKIIDFIKQEFNYEPKIKDYENYSRFYITDHVIGKQLCEKMYANFVFPYGHSKTIRYYEAFDLSIPINNDSVAKRDFNTIIPFMFTNPVNGKALWLWGDAMLKSEIAYKNLIELGATPQEARDVLPTSVKADIIMTTNIREWVHILELRALGTTGKPHPQMEEVMIPLAKELASGLLSDFTCIDSVDKMLSL